MKEGIVVPVLVRPRREDRFKQLGHALLLPPIALILEGHRDQVLRVRDVVWADADLECLVKDVERDALAVVAVIPPLIPAARIGGPVYDAQVFLPGPFDALRAGVPVERLLIMLPALVPIAPALAQPVVVAE